MEWIDAQEKLPDDSERILLFTPYHVLGEHTFVGNRESITTCTARIQRKLVPVFTHWMPLPSDPKRP